MTAAFAKPVSFCPLERERNDLFSQTQYLTQKINARDCEVNGPSSKGQRPRFPVCRPAATNEQSQFSGPRVIPLLFATFASQPRQLPVVGGGGGI